MNPLPLVSVIVPAYNHEKYISRSLQSIVDQNYQNIEIIIIDDGSKDRTTERIQEFISHNSASCVVFVKKENEGVCRTLNLGISLAKGDYIAFLASDDVYLPEKTTKQVEFLETNLAVSMVFSDAYFLNFEENTGELWSNYKSGISKYFRNGIQNCDMYDLLLTHPIIPALTVMVRKAVLDRVGQFDVKLVYEDDDMWFRIALDGAVGYIDEPLALYRMHDTNISNNSFFMLRGIFSTIRKHFKIGPYKYRLWKKLSCIIRLAKNVIVSRVRRKIRRIRGLR